MIFVRQIVGISICVALLVSMGAVANFAGLGNFAIGTALAQDKKTPPRKTRKTPAMREIAFKKIEKAQQYVDEKDYASALEELDEMSRMRGLNSYETAMMWNFRAYIYYDQDKYGDAINAYKQVLAQPDLPLGFEDQIKYGLAQLYFVEENYTESLKYLDDWLQYQESPNAQAYILKGQIHYQLQQYREAIEPIETAIRLTEESGGQVKENWWLLLRSMYYELNDLPKVREILEILVLNWPKPEYWLQLASVYGDTNEDAKQLATMEIAYQEGALVKENHLVTLAQLYMYNEVPIKAARVMQKGMEDKIVEGTERNYEILAQALVAAKEFDSAIAPMKRAAELSDEGELFTRLASVYMERERWDDCVDAISQGLKKGSVDRPDQASMVQGMCFYNNDDLSGALGSFRSARRDDRSRQAASQWITFLTKEQERRRQIAQMSQ